MVGEAEGSPNQQPSHRGDWLFPQHVDIHDGGELCRGYGGYIHVKTMAPWGKMSAKTQCFDKCISTFTVCLGTA